MQAASPSESIPTMSSPVKVSSWSSLVVRRTSTSTWSATLRQSKSSLLEANRASVSTSSNAGRSSSNLTRMTSGFSLAAVMLQARAGGSTLP